MEERLDTQTVSQTQDSRAVQNFYDAFYEAGDFAHYSDAAYDSFFRAMKKFFPASGSILDVGCGSGRQLCALTRVGHRSTGIDLSMKALEKAKNSAMQSTLLRANAMQLPFRVSSFDGAYTFGCSLLNTASLAQIEAMIRETLRVLREGAWFIAVTQTDFSGRVRGGWYQLTSEELRRLQGDQKVRLNIFFTHLRLFSWFGSLALSKGMSIFVRALVPKRRRLLVLAIKK